MPTSKLRAHKTNANRRNALDERIWSRRWLDDTDLGTIIYTDNDTADYYDGNEWKTVSRRDLAL